ncbi:MAG: MFS transporter, partial [Pedobacter sp.]
GIYPVGMKIAADHYEKGLGKSLGFLVGALVLGTAFPHLLKSMTSGLPWKYVLFGTSFLAVVGGFAMFLRVPDGPYRRPGNKLNPREFFQCFSNPDFRAASIGYFGHMWELYAFWVFLPLLLTNYQKLHQGLDLNIPLLCFGIIATGAISCMVSGLISSHFGVKRTASIALLLSGLCCLASPLFLAGSSVTILIIFLIFWSIVVIADSPLFSTLVAQTATPTSRGTALTLVNCIGFSITIVSIQLINTLLTDGFSIYIFMLLALGPIIGLTALYTKKLGAAGSI